VLFLSVFCYRERMLTRITIHVSTLANNIFIVHTRDWRTVNYVIR
jgi:hypothetical protein